ncbi:hypothetical protein ACJX0J_013254, partial [Zea mays]
FIKILFHLMITPPDNNHFPYHVYASFSLTIFTSIYHYLLGIHNFYDFCCIQTQVELYEIFVPYLAPELAVEVTLRTIETTSLSSLLNKHYNIIAAVVDLCLTVLVVRLKIWACMKQYIYFDIILVIFFWLPIVRNAEYINVIRKKGYW